MTTASPAVGVIMGSRSDWETMKAAAHVLRQFDVPHECRVVSAHRTPAWMVEYARDAEARGLQVIIAGAGGAAHLPGMVASMTTVPVVGVPVQSKALSGLGPARLRDGDTLPVGTPAGPPAPVDFTPWRDPPRTSASPAARSASSRSSPARTSSSVRTAPT